MVFKHRRIVAVLALGMGLWPASGRGQNVPWLVYADPFSSSVCDVVNTSNGELVVLHDTGQLALVTGTDVVLVLTFVDSDGFVFYDGDLVGVIEFEDDADGFRTLWWLSLSGRVIEVGDLSGAPLETNLFPANFGDVPCDACEFWDDPSDCFPLDVDDDFDGVPDIVDLCLDTPFGEIVDEVGCSCSDLDLDLDGVGNCDDFCPDTLPGEFVDFDGCACSDLDDDRDGILNCGDECPGTALGLDVDVFGCSCADYDDDLDGVDNCEDQCPNTSPVVDVDFDGCTIDVIDDDGGVVTIACGNVGFLSYSLMLVGLVGCASSRRRGQRRG